MKHWARFFPHEHNLWRQIIVKIWSLCKSYLILLPQTHQETCQNGVAFRRKKFKFWCLISPHQTDDVNDNSNDGKWQNDDSINVDAAHRWHCSKSIPENGKDNTNYTISSWPYIVGCRGVVQSSTGLFRVGFIKVRSCSNIESKSLNDAYLYIIELKFLTYFFSIWRSSNRKI